MQGCTPKKKKTRRSPRGNRKESKERCKTEREEVVEGRRAVDYVICEAGRKKHEFCFVPEHKATMRKVLRSLS